MRKQIQARKAGPPLRRRRRHCFAPRDRRHPLEKAPGWWARVYTRGSGHRPGAKSPPYLPAVSLAEQMELDWILGDTADIQQESPAGPELTAKPEQRAYPWSRAPCTVPGAPQWQQCEPCSLSGLGATAGSRELGWIVSGDVAIPGILSPVRCSTLDIASQQQAASRARCPAKPAEDQLEWIVGKSDFAVPRLLSPVRWEDHSILVACAAAPVPRCDGRVAEWMAGMELDWILGEPEDGLIC